MEYLPLALDIKDKPCLLVGGGDIALRKARLLDKAGAKISVVAPDINKALVELVQKNGGCCHVDIYQKDYLDTMLLVIAATNNNHVNVSVAKDCEAQNILVNVVDTPELCRVIFPAIIDRDPILIAVSSAGAAPVLTRSVRSNIESAVPANLGLLAHYIGERRAQVRQRLPDQRVRLFWENLVESEVAEMVMSGRLQEADSLFSLRLEQAEKENTDICGEVYLVGAGPGDPDLLTFKALRLMQRADVVLYDRLVSQSIVEMCRRDAEFIYVGKARSDHTVPQHDINQLLIDHALTGKKVVRLKGGDPFVFGRGGEEIEGLSEHKIPFQIVPGISAANGCACYAGIPLTHRDYAQSVRFLTGHMKDGSIDLPWQELADGTETLVIYMGLNDLQTICEQLQAHGASADTAVALIERGTTPQQRVHTGALSSIAKLVASRDVHAPTLIIIGNVVRLHSLFSWRQ